MVHPVKRPTGDAHPNAPVDEPSAAPSLRIAICTVGELFGGVERHILGLCSGLATRKIKPLLLLFHDGELAAQARAQGIEPAILPSDNWSLLTTSRQLAKLLQRSRINIVHVHGYKAAANCTLARYWYRPFVTVKTVHGLPEPSASGIIPNLRTRLYHFVDDWATRATGMSICYVTEELRQHYRHAYSGLSERVIPNGIGQINRNQLDCPPEFHGDRFNVAIVGRVDAVKGHEWAIRAMADASMPTAVHLHVVGTGPDEDILRTLAERLGVSRRIHFLGFRRDVYRYLAHCQVLAMPSLHEGMPYTLLESMALGCPIVASRVGGLAEVLQDSVTALLVSPGDAHALALAVQELYNNPGLRKRLAANAQELQRRKYSLDAMTESYLGVYRQTLEMSFSPLS
jgi:glycosyltransferase involved in cell wall biosynthesis